MRTSARLKGNSRRRPRRRKQQHEGAQGITRTGSNPPQSVLVASQQDGVRRDPMRGDQPLGRQRSRQRRALPVSTDLPDATMALTTGRGPRLVFEVAHMTDNNRTATSALTVHKNMVAKSKFFSFIFHTTGLNGAYEVRVMFFLQGRG